MKKILRFITVLYVMLSCSSDKIIDMPIVFDEERTELTLEYLQEHYDLRQKEPTITPQMVVVHWTVIPTMEESFEAFKEAKLPNKRPDIVKASALNVSSQFLVDRDGTIYRLMPENFMARHVIGLNHCAIGIENVGGTGELPLTPEQLESNIWIINYLKDKYDILYLIGHYEYTLFEGHELWLEKDDGYRTEKNDPGEQFMEDIRSAVRGLDLKDNPTKIKIESDSLISN